MKIRDISWSLFALTGRVDLFLLYKKLDGQFTKTETIHAEENVKRVGNKGSRYI